MSKVKAKGNTTNNFSTDDISEGRKESVAGQSLLRTRDLTGRRRKRMDRRSIFISRIRRRALRHLWLVRIGILAGIILAIYLFITITGVVIRNTRLGFYAGLAGDFVFTPSTKVKSRQGRTNLVVLGKGGRGHEAPDLTDTIIFASVEHPTSPGLRGESNPSVTLISLSRDIWIPEIRAKLNSTYYWGNQKQEGGGLVLAKSTIEKVVGVPVHYGVVVDFSGFTEIIDEMGGIEVDVERAFIDELYPIPGREEDECDGDPEYKCRYETVSFEEGVQAMDGETALKFVRSRNAEGDEGTDFARAARQEKVLTATREVATSLRVLANPKKILAIISVLRKTVETDIDPSAAVILARRIFSAKENIYSEVLPEELLVNPPKSARYDNLYVFIPKGDPSTGSGQAWSEVHEWVGCVLDNGECE